MDSQLVIIVDHVEDGLRLHGVLDLDSLLFRAQADMNISEVQLLLHEVALRFVDLTQASKLLVCPVLDLHEE
jgi:hypothetical protein